MATAQQPTLSYDASSTAFLLVRVENYTEHDMQYCTHEFSSGDFKYFDGSPPGPGQAKYWSCASNRWLQGNVGCVVCSLPAAEVEVMLMWNFAYGGTREDRIGVRIGQLGKFSKMDRISLVDKFDDSAVHSSDMQIAVHDGMVAGCSFGRDPAIFFIASTTLSLCRPITAAPHQVNFDPSVRSFLVCELENETSAWLRLVQASFFAGQCRSAAPMLVREGSVVRWSCGSATHLSAVGRGNVGCLIFSIEDADASSAETYVCDYLGSASPDAPRQTSKAGTEIMLMWFAPSVGQDAIGCRIGVGGAFSQLKPPDLQKILNGKHHFSTAAQTRSIGDFTISSSFGRDPARFTLSQQPVQSADAGNNSGDNSSQSSSAPELGTRAPTERLVKPVFNHKVSCFCVCELRNLSSMPLLFERSFFNCGDAASAFSLSVQPQSSTFWTIGNSSSAAIRGCVGGAIYSIGTDAEVVFVFHLARVGQQCVGCHIGPVGRYTAMSSTELKKLLEPAILSPSTQITSQAEHPRYTAGASFGRDPARFYVFERDQAPVLIASASLLTPVDQLPAHDSSTPSCHLLGLLMNRTSSELKLMRVELIKGEVRAAISLEPIASSHQMCWSATTSPTLQPKSLGNVGIIIFQLARKNDAPGAATDVHQAMPVELAVVWNFPYAVPTARSEDVIPTVGLLINQANTFSMMSNDQLSSIAMDQSCQEPSIMQIIHGSYAATAVMGRPAIFAIYEREAATSCTKSIVESSGNPVDFWPVPRPYSGQNSEISVLCQLKSDWKSGSVVFLGANFVGGGRLLHPPAPQLACKADTLVAWTSTSTDLWSGNQGCAIFGLCVDGATSSKQIQEAPNVVAELLCYWNIANSHRPEISGVGCRLGSAGEFSSLSQSGLEMLLGNPLIEITKEMSDPQFRPGGGVKPLIALQPTKESSTSRWTNSIATMAALAASVGNSNPSSSQADEDAPTGYSMTHYKTKTADTGSINAECVVGTGIRRTNSASGPQDPESRLALDLDWPPSYCCSFRVRGGHGDETDSALSANADGCPASGLSADLQDESTSENGLVSSVPSANNKSPTDMIVGRLKHWNGLSEQQHASAAVLGWDASSWDAGECPPVVDLVFAELSDEQQSAAEVLGFQGAADWDVFEEETTTSLEHGCNISNPVPAKHQYWAELQQKQQEAAAVLGWDASSWDAGECPPVVDLLFAELSDEQQSAAEVLGFQGAADWDVFED